MYDNIGNYLRDLKLSKEDLTNYIIGTMNKLDPPLTSAQRGKIGLNRYITNAKNEDYKKQMDQVLSTTVEGLKSYEPLLEKVMEQDYICVLGNERKIQENKDVFLNLVQLKK